MRKIKMVLNKFMAITTGELLTVGFFTNILYPIEYILADSVYVLPMCTQYINLSG